MKEESILSIFIDESGNLSCSKDSSRFYIVSLVLHEQTDSIDGFVRELDAAYDAMHLPNLCFHAGPLIRREEGYEYMDWELRNRIFARMMAFARKVPFHYQCFCIDKRFASSDEQIVTRLEADVTGFLGSLSLADNKRIKVYYDCGQATLTKMIHSVMLDRFGDRWAFAQGVRPLRYRLFQVADLICTISLIERKLDEGLPLTKSEDMFFGGARNFRRNILKPLKKKQM